MKNTIEEIFNTIIRSNNIFYRGLNLGATKKEIEAKEGFNYINKSGVSKPHYKYFYEVGEVEEINIYYGFSPKNEKLSNITLYFFSFPDYYWRKKGGKNIAHFNKLMYDEQISEFSAIFDEVTKMVLDIFVSELGAPKIHREHNVFNKGYQHYIAYSWNIENETSNKRTNLLLIKYLDDSIFDDVKLIMKLLLTEK